MSCCGLEGASRVQGSVGQRLPNCGCGAVLGVFQSGASRPEQRRPRGRTLQQQQQRQGPGVQRLWALRRLSRRCGCHHRSIAPSLHSSSSLRWHHSTRDRRCDWKSVTSHTERAVHPPSPSSPARAARVSGSGGHLRLLATCSRFTPVPRLVSPSCCHRDQPPPPPCCALPARQQLETQVPVALLIAATSSDRDLAAFSLRSPWTSS